jgi:hypothetical protein
MASNNSQWPQQQGWVTKGGGGRKRNPSNSPHQSEISINSRKRQDVIHKLKDMFIDIFDLEIIQSVAHSCEFNCKYCSCFMCQCSSKSKTVFNIQPKDEMEELSVEINLMPVTFDQTLKLDFTCSYC